MDDKGLGQEDELTFKEFRNQLQQLRFFIKSLFRLAWRNIRRYYLIIIVLFAVFVVLGYNQYKNSKVFEAKASFVYIELQKKTYGEMLDKLQYMLMAKSYHRVSEALAIPVEQARSIIAINAENIYGSKLSEDITDGKKIFYVNILTTNSKVFDSLQYSIEHYLNNNVLVKELVTRRKTMLKQKIDYEKRELAMLDSLKAAYTNNLNQSTGSVYPVASQFNPVPLYEKGEKIMHDLTEMQALLDDYRAVQTQDRFLVTEEPYGKSVLSYAVLYFTLFLISCIGLFFIISIFKK